MTENSVIETLPNEANDLGLHVALCEQRYLQLITKFDSVDAKFEKIENMLVEIRGTIKKDTTDSYLKWAGAIIILLGSALLGVVTHLIR